MIIFIKRKITAKKKKKKVYVPREQVTSWI